MMDVLNLLVLVFGALALVVAMAAVALLFARRRPSGTPGTYRGRPLMTENELEFFGRLVAALPQHYIFPQVAMSALLEPASHSKKSRHSDRLRVAQQRVDYVVCDKRCDVVAVVELDDRTHQRSRDKIRDERLRQAGVRTVRFEARAKPTAAAIRSIVLPADPASVIAEASVRFSPA
ncbi:DUF2726 domain-containing protein [Pseudoduganella albidiflava]|uniref:DUF2726 domain-containing protein n=1 Tax=Pseudoduganella albidiflava TaxID=321983 RepID=A0A411WZ17_9BURK|nr:DUF2726 domain-containing protein [Pseudoduganella albidiflava]QBI01957.1 DUF2726 domain-containing protein [Pseudoduganella albidiflava]GGY38238.1 hypothetical protein GCM10007387_20280 [Pseudoduganella albidiflava]